MEPTQGPHHHHYPISLLREVLCELGYPSSLLDEALAYAEVEDKPLVCIGGRSGEAAACILVRLLMDLSSVYGFLPLGVLVAGPRSLVEGLEATRVAEAGYLRSGRIWYAVVRCSSPPECLEELRSLLRKLGEQFTWYYRAGGELEELLPPEWLE